ncbi:MAG: membrane lipoprotein lipid attachment site-containing protein [Pseudomonadota bacterium]
MKKYILILGLALVLSSCRPLWLGMVDPSGPPEYKLGWEDGCDSGISAEGNWADKMMYGFKKRQEMAANDQYKQAWNEGFTYCRFSYASSKEPGSFKNIGLGDGFD